MAKSVKKPVETPPYLKSVRIRDYAPLRDAKVSFKPGLNIIIGGNGAGKTRFLTLARELVDLDQGHFTGLGCQLIIQANKRIKVEFKKEKVNAVDLARETFRFVDAPQQLLIRVDVNGSIREAGTLAHALWPDQSLLFLTYLPVIIRHGIPTTGLPIIEESADWSLKDRTISADLKSGKRYIYELEGQFKQQLFRKIFAEVRGHFPELQPKPPHSAEWVRERIKIITEAYVLHFNNYLPLYSPIQCIRLVETFLVYYTASQDEYIIKGLVLEYYLNNEWLPFSKLSDGTKRLFYIMTELLSPFTLIQSVEGKKPVWQDASKIIFLEEPELGIHPAQLHKLLSLIREVSREHQVIMTTHSPQVLDMLTEKELDRITVCTLDQKKGTQFHKLGRQKQQQAREYMQEVGFLSDYWRYSFLEETDTE